MTNTTYEVHSPKGGPMMTFATRADAQRAIDDRARVVPGLRLFAVTVTRREITEVVA